MKFIVNSEDTVNVKIEVVCQKDAKGIERPKVLNRKGVEEYREDVSQRLLLKRKALAQLESVSSTIVQERREEEIIRLTSEIKIFEELVKSADSMLTSEAEVFTAVFRRPDWALANQIDNESVVDTMTGRGFSETARKQSKLKHLLISWDLYETDEKGEKVIVPISAAMKLEPNILDAFFAEFDRKLMISEEETKN